MSTSTSTSASEASSPSQWNGIKTPFSMKGAQVLIHWTFFFLLIINLIAVGILYRSWDRFWSEFFMLGPILFICAYVHELAKSFVNSRLGGSNARVVLWPLGGLTLYGPADQGAIGDLKVGIAGPIVHIPLAGIFYLLYFVAEKTIPDGQHLEEGFKHIFAMVCRNAVAWNAVLFAIHLLIPIYPLDGIRIWAGLLRSANVSLERTAKLIAYAGMGISIFFFIYGAIVLVSSSYGLGLSQVLIGGFGFSSSKVLYDLVEAGRLTSDPVFGRSCYADDRTDDTSVGIEATSSTPSSAPIDNAETSEII